MSFQAKVIKLAAKLRRPNRRMERKISNPLRGTDALSVDHFTRKVRVKQWNAGGYPGITVNGSYPKNYHLLFLPGGTYVDEPSAGHRRVAEKFALEDQIRVSVFCYPLAPEHTAEETHRALLAAYQMLRAEYPQDEFFLFGDAAGGGLALAFLQGLKYMGTIPLPKRTALVSPWLDISLTNPKIKLARRDDPILSPEALIQAGEQYRGGFEPDDPVVSPLYGPLEGLGPILVFAGTEEIMAPDCELLAEKAAVAEGTGLIFKEAAGMLHDWILMRCPETDAALDLIAGFFLEEEDEDSDSVVTEVQEGLRKVVQKQ